MVKHGMYVLALVAGFAVAWVDQALARGGGGGHAGVVVRGGVVRPGVPRFGRAPGREFARARGVRRLAGPVVALPYVWPLDPAGGPQVVSVPIVEPAPLPPVFVVAGAPVSAVVPDFGYVRGCLAIPGGYHCEVPRNVP
jgi:hypothetical protein